ncbi:Histone-lysine N-methyltransferase SETMAR [Melipona quadrifasciata]|uniref:Histone-lysine N-methyltransferase SETMAR n=1 Tax=Melipona quadrifasciata TaxID=166423 RepID=A0A0M8ZY86_9HYME|nr:Histone-lysine N-methyltransferase SETMAR [Melipona quadrifasciata]
MASQIPEEVHIRHCMLFEFHKSNNATVATKNICDVYPSALDVRKCKFKFGNFYLSDSYRSRKPTTLDNDMLRTEVEANPCRTIEELSDTLNQPWSTIQKRLQQIGKVRRAGVWVPHNLLHFARRTLEKINELGWEVLPHPPHSFDIAPSDFHLFRSLQHFLNGKKFENLDDVQNAISRYFA